MNPGDLDNLVTIQQPKDPPPRTASGAVDKSDPDYWQAYAQRWAKEEPSGGREFTSAKARFSDLTHVLTLWIDSGITNKMRVLFNGIPLDILAARHTPRDLGQESAMKTTLICKEGRSAGN